MLIYGDLTNEPTGQTTLVSFPERVVPTGTIHQLNHRLIHEATLDPGDGMIATVSVRGPRHRWIGEVFTPEPRHDAGPRLVKIDTRESLRRFREEYVNI